MEQQQVPGAVLRLLKASAARHTRNVFVVVGDEGRELVPTLHAISSRVRPPSAKPTVLWCYKSDLGFSTNRKKRMKQVKKLKSRGLYDPAGDDASFDRFAASTHVRWCYYKETDRILGQTFGFLVLQDFEALTPNILARTVETVEGGGSVIFLLKTMDSLKRLYSLTMDVHVKFATSNNKHVRPRFNERFILSLSHCGAACLVLDEEMNLLPVLKSSHDGTSDGNDGDDDSDHDQLTAYIANLPKTSDGILSCLTSLAKTVDQAKCVAAFVEAVSSKTLNYTMSLTASRGRGKSAALGIALACAVAYGYSNIFLTAPSPDNLQTVFEFAVRALDALKFVEHTDYELVSSSASHPHHHQQQQQQDASMQPAQKSLNMKHMPAVQKNIVRINIFRTHRQTIQYIAPTETSALAQAEMVVVDEAAAIPLPLVKKLLGPYLVLLSSTIDGYEGTGRSLSLKLFDELRTSEPKNRRILKEVALQTPIRYARNDPVERWLNDLLCLDAKSPALSQGTPHPSECELFLVDRDTLFSRHKMTEQVLRRIVGLMVASHYKNTPNDLQLLSDAPAHRLFVLLGPSSDAQVPDVLCVAQVAFEGNIPGSMVKEQLAQGNRSSGDMLPWTIAQQFQDNNFAQLSGARVVRIASHQDAFSMGYGSRMLELLARYFKGEMVLRNQPEDEDEEEDDTFESMGGNADGDDNDAEEDAKIRPRKKLNPLLVPAADVPPPTVLDYLGVSFGMTPKLFRFWDKAGFFPLYLRQTENTVTGEHSCIMIKPLGEQTMAEFSMDFMRRYGMLLHGAFRAEPTTLALAILSSGPKAFAHSTDSLTEHDYARLEAYSRNLVDHHLITDLLPRLAERFFFSPEAAKPSLSALQQALLVGMGLQMKTIEELSEEFKLASQQLLAMLNKAVRKFSKAQQSQPNGEPSLEDAASKLPSGVKPGTIVSLPSSKKEEGEEEDTPEPRKREFKRAPGSKHKRSRKEG